MSTIYKECWDCRKINRDHGKQRIKTRKLAAADSGMYFCTGCHKDYAPEEWAMNIDGTPSILCKGCKSGERDRSIKIRTHYRSIKFEFISKHGCSCQRCKCIFVFDEIENIVKKYVTYVEGDTEKKTYVSHNGVSYEVSEFIREHKNILELDILQLDHLPETEQRARGLLAPEEVYQPKKANVSKLSSEASMRLEARKCQLLCAECHLVETIMRENEGDYMSTCSLVERAKRKQTDSMKLVGCSMCHYVNPDLLRFFHFDHLSPLTKAVEVSRMVKDKKYTMEDVLEECNKCRILCGHCHLIHTRDQRMNCKIPLNRKKRIVSPNLCMCGCAIKVCRKFGVIYSYISGDVAYFGFHVTGL